MSDVLCLIFHVYFYFLCVLCLLAVIWVPKLWLPPVLISIFGPKTAKFGPKYTFVVIFGQILAFLAHLVPCPTKKQCKQGAYVFFTLCGYQNFCFLLLKLGFFAQNDQILLEIGIFGHFGPGLAGSFGALLVGWLVVVARGLYLARHLFTLLIEDKSWSDQWDIDAPKFFLSLN